MMNYYVFNFDTQNFERVLREDFEKIYFACYSKSFVFQPFILGDQVGEFVFDHHDDDYFLLAFWSL